VSRGERHFIDFYGVPFTRIAAGKDDDFDSNPTILRGMSDPDSGAASIFLWANLDGENRGIQAIYQPFRRTIRNASARNA